MRGRISASRQSLPEGAGATWAQKEMDLLRQQAQAWLASTLEPVRDSTRASHRSVPDIEAWQASVSSALDAIDRHTSTRSSWRGKNGFQPRSRFRRSMPCAVQNCATLRAHSSPCRLARAGSFGATPERLVRLVDERVDVTCLAGSIGIGNTPQEREQLARELLASAKNREEHEIVVCAAYDALEPVCHDVRRDARFSSGGGRALGAAPRNPGYRHDALTRQRARSG